HCLGDAVHFPKKSSRALEAVLAHGVTNCERSNTQMPFQTELKYEGRDHCDGWDHAQAPRAERYLDDCSPAIGEDKSPKQSALTVPLSVCTADLGDVSARDMAGWITRSASIRRREARQREGHVARPLNSFMLYRSAYLKRARAWCRQNKEQVLSQVIAASWKMEPPEVRERYEQFAKLERLNHSKAHPTYKYAPQRARAGHKAQKFSLREECGVDQLDLRS
ncbi:hypothetical protein HBI23_258560, partial [Parastagonospora nodorum]